MKNGAFMTVFCLINGIHEIQENNVNEIIDETNDTEEKEDES